MSERNPFGGRNPHGLYVPLTDDELEVLERLALAGEFQVVVKDWGHVTNFRLGRYNPATYTGQPLVVFGDKRISFYFRMDFTAPAVPQPCWYFDLEVWALGERLFPSPRRDEKNPFPGRLPTMTNGQPIQIAAGIFIDLALDVALDLIDPALVKKVKPKAIGLTTRQDNMHLNLEQQRLLEHMRTGERVVREMSAREAVDVTKKSTGQ